MKKLLFVNCYKYTFEEHKVTSTKNIVTHFFYIIYHWCSEFR